GKLATKALFEEAVSLYNIENYQESLKAFEACLTLNPIDRVTKFYLEQIRQIPSNPQSPGGL
ncbi:MAG: tetratricopeptide repeat protein, partial [Planktothrix sp.]